MNINILNNIKNPICGAGQRLGRGWCSWAGVEATFSERRPPEPTGIPLMGDQQRLEEVYQQRVYL